MPKTPYGQYINSRVIAHKDIEFESIWTSFVLIRELVVWPDRIYRPVFDRDKRPLTHHHVGNESFKVAAPTGSN